MPGNNTNHNGERLVYCQLYNVAKRNKEDTSKWKDIPCSYIGSIKMKYYPKWSTDSVPSVSKSQ